MRVLHVIPSIAPRYGGPSTVVVHMCRALREQGIDVTLATMDADGTGRLDVRLGSPLNYDGVSTIFFRRQFSESFKFSRPFSRWLMAHVADFDCVHIHAVFSHSSLSAARACRRRTMPYIVRPLGSLETWSLRQKPIRKRLALALGVRKMLMNAAAIHYTTDRERRESESALGLSRGVVIPLGVEISPQPHPPSPSRADLSSERLPGGEGGTILFLSRLHPKKGVEILLEAFGTVVKATNPAAGQTSPPAPLQIGEGWRGTRAGVRSSTQAGTVDDFRLVIAGSGEPAYERQLRRLAESLGIAERVTFAGWLDGGAKAAALARADLFVLPSAQENFGLSVLEAMAAGIPVAVSREVDLSDEVEASGAGWVFERTVEGIAAALGAAIENPDERRRRGKNGREAAWSKFTWPVIAGRLEQLYRSVLLSPVLTPGPSPQLVERGGATSDGVRKEVNEHGNVDNVDG